MSECEWTLLACTRLLSASSWSGQTKRLPGVRCTVPSFAISVVAHLDNQRGWGVEGEDPGLASRACMKTLYCLQCWSRVVDISKPLMLFCYVFPSALRRLSRAVKRTQQYETPQILWVPFAKEQAKTADTRAKGRGA